MITRSSVLENLEFNDSKPSFKVLLNNDSTKEIRILMRKGQMMKKHAAPYPIVVEVFSGLIDFGVQGEKYVLGRGDLISVSSRIPHDLLAQEDAVIRLSLSKNDSEARLSEVIG